MNHLDVVTSTLVTNPVAAGLAIRLGSNALEDVLDVWPGLGVATGHQAGAVAGTLLTTGDTGANESDTLRGQVLRTAVAVGIVRVTAVNDDITLLKVGEKSLNEIIDWLAGHDEKHDLAGALELSAELLDGVSTDD